MAIQTLFVDGFDHYATADLTKKWSTASVVTIDTSLKRNGSGSLKLTTGSSLLVKTLPMNARTLIVGLALYPASLGNTDLITLRASGSSTLLLAANSSGQLRVVRGVSYSSTPELGISTETLQAGAWQYIEFRTYLDDAAGEFEVRLNGATVISGTGVDTTFNSANYANEFSLEGVGGSYIDDLYVRGDTVLTAGGFLGDCKVITSYPDAAGSSTQLTPTGAASNFEATDDTAPDGDTTYVESATAGHRDLYGIGNIAQGGGTIHAVQLSALSRKTDTGYRAQKLVVKSGATTDVGAEQALSTDYTYKTRLLEVDPNTSSPWLESNLDAAEFGLDVA